MKRLNFRQVKRLSPATRSVQSWMAALCLLALAPAARAQDSTTTRDDAAARSQTEHPRAAKGLEASFKVGAFRRMLRYNDDIFQRLQSYTLKTGPWLEGDLAMFPGALAGDTSAISWFGIEGSYGQAVGLDSERYAGESFDTSTHAYRVGLAARIPVGQHRVLGSVAYGRRLFEVDSIVPDNALYPAEPGVPSADYQFVRIGAGFDFRATRALSLVTELGYRAVVGEGDIATDTWFPNASAGGIDFTMQLRYALSDALDVRAGFQLERYFFTLNPEVGDSNVAGGALDQYLGAFVGVGYAL
ncbi:MAG: hypothetical protein AB7K71_38685 [Polyangiaceae bacterium]